MYQKYGDNVKCLRFINTFLKRLMAKLITFETIPSEIGAVNTFFLHLEIIVIKVKLLIFINISRVEIIRIGLINGFFKIHYLLYGGKGDADSSPKKIIFSESIAQRCFYFTGEKKSSYILSIHASNIIYQTTFWHFNNYVVF